MSDANAGQTVQPARVDALVLPLMSEAARKYADLLDDRASAIRERTGTLSDVDTARRQFGPSLVRISWMYADVAFQRPELKHVCTWSNGDEGFVFVGADQRPVRVDTPLAKDPFDDPV